MNFLPDLPLAKGNYDAVRLMKIKTLRIPRQTDEIQHPPGPTLLIFDQRLVRNFQQRRRGKGSPPVIRKPDIFAVKVRQVVKIVRVGVKVGEILEVNRQARIDGMAAQVD